MILTACNYTGDNLADNYSVVINEIQNSDSTIQETEESKSSNEVNHKATDSEFAAVNYNDYIVNLKINPEKRIVTGIEKIKYYNTTGTVLNDIYLNVYLNAFRRDNDYSPFLSTFNDNVFKYGKDYSVVNITGVTVNNKDVPFKLDDIILSVDLPEPLLQDDSVEIILQFDCYIPKISHRTGANDAAMWFGNFIPTVAVFDKSGWNLDKYYPVGTPFYSQIANYFVIIETPAEYSVVSTSIGTVTKSEGKNITTVNAKMVRDFAFAVSKDYKVDSIVTENGITINFYHYSQIENISEFLNIAKKSLEYYGELIGSYPYQYLHIIECELFFQTGMQYPQFIMMDQQLLKKKRAVSSLIHEICHQWFYNIIGNNQITNSWINEGLIMLIQQDILSSRAEIDNAMLENYFALHKNFNTKLKDDPSFNPTLTAPIDSFTSWQSYCDVYYTRAKLMMYSLQNKMGKEKFDKFLKTYYKKYAFNEVDIPDFTKTAEEVYGSSLTDFFNGWIYAYNLPPL